LVAARSAIPVVGSKPSSSDKSTQPAAGLRIEEGDHLLELGLRLVDPRHVSEADRDTGLDVHLGLALADGHEARASGAAGEPGPHHAEEQERDDPG
jgi:hypothetical protein